MVANGLRSCFSAADATEKPRVWPAMTNPLNGDKVGEVGFFSSSTGSP